MSDFENAFGQPILDDAYRTEENIDNAFTEKNTTRQQPEQPFDCGPNPAVINMRRETVGNPYFRNTIWTGRYLQTTLMCIPVGKDVGLEIHHGLDQFFYVEEGVGVAKTGYSRERPDRQDDFRPGCAIYIPSGTWHNIINMGNTPLKLFSIYAPPQHPFNTLHETQEIAEAAEHH